LEIEQVVVSASRVIIVGYGQPNPDNGSPTRFASFRSDIPEP